MAKRKPRTIGVPWFRPTDYGEARRLCPELPLSFAVWRKGARRVLDAATAQGVLVVQVYVTAAELAAFAKQRRVPFIGSEVLIDWCQDRAGSESQRQGSAADFEKRFRRQVAQAVAQRKGLSRS